MEKLVRDLSERAKELNCLYNIEEILNNDKKDLDEIFQRVVEVIPPGWQYPEITGAKLQYGSNVYKTSNYLNTPWIISAAVILQDREVGELSVCLTEDASSGDSEPFLKEEIKLLKTITDRLGHFILHKDIGKVFKDFYAVSESLGESHSLEWRIILDMIRKTDPNLFMSILRKLLHLLCWNGVPEADELLRQSSITAKESGDEMHLEENRPQKKLKINNYDEYIEAILNLASNHLNEEDVLKKIQKWIQEDKSSGLVKAVETQGTSLAEIGDAIRKYYHLAPEKFELSMQTIKGLRVSLLRRFFTDDLTFISVAKEYVKLTDFYNLIDRMIYPPSSHGKLGGKSSGLFLANNILTKDEENSDILKDIKVPKTWYMTSDSVLSFMHYNNLEEVLEQKYKEIDEVRLEYPHIVQLFKNSQFPPDIVKGLSMVLDDMGDKPIIVRSSSLLEDQMGAAFSGKYKSLFLANKGTKQFRLAALTDAIAEVYASTFAPDPIEYRAERGLLDYHEEMGIMIQEVVGTQIGKYYLPAFAGVAFSKNEFRWSSRIKREDGILRIVMGLGTRAVDRVSDDYPTLIAPGQPNLRVNVTIEEKIKYSQQKIDLINLEKNEFETRELDDLLGEIGNDLPALEKVISVVSGNMIRTIPFDVDFDENEFVVTFDGLIDKTNFIKKIDLMLKTLQRKLKTPVDIEFASDGKDFYLLQCRPQSYSIENAADPIPKEVPIEKTLFTADKYISNGKVPEITHIVYVDPLKYSDLPDRATMLKVGKAVSRLNKTLPKRKFILMGPGRWGSRGDIKLGVSVTYSDINNTAVLIEIARKKGNYVPDLSFGTHFFQDLVEASIRYLPLYPDDEGIIFNEKFLNKAENISEYLIPEFKDLKDVVKVIDVKKAAEGKILKILMNAELDEAIGLITSSSEIPHPDEVTEELEFIDNVPTNQWRWRMKMAEKISAALDFAKYNVKGIYIFGSVKNASARPGSDIDLIVHIDKEKEHLEELMLWFEGWSLCLSEMNYLRTGYKSDGLLDVHYITDEDIEKKSSYAVKIDAVTDAARLLRSEN
jgi:predicted nucleotidyltransferase